MNRRGFLRSLIGAAAVVPAVRTWPFRVFSFPSAPVLTPEAGRRMLEHIRRALAIDDEKLWIVSPDQAMALELEKLREEIPLLIRNGGMIYKHYAEHERIVTWNNLQRSPIRWSSRNDSLQFPA